MIIQCDQCNTKFKLDEAKVPDKGIKVRCARCKHVFMVQKETSSEEPDLDFLLSGLGAPAPDVEKGISPEGETPSSPIGKEELHSFVQGPATAGEGENGHPGAGSVEQAQDGEFGEDFFAVKDVPAVPENKDSEFEEFSFDNEETQTSFEAGAALEVPPGKTDKFEFNEFPFEKESISESDTVAAPISIPPETEEFNFESAEFAAEVPAEMRSGEDLGSVAAGESQEGKVIFGEVQGVPQTENQVMEEKPESLAKVEESIDFSEFTVPPVVGDESGNLTSTVQEERKETKIESPDFGDFDFGDTSAAGSAELKEEEIKPGFEVFPEPAVEDVSPPSFVSLMPSAEDELPPLAISTRKKGVSFFSMTATVIAVLVVLAIAGVGFYVFKEGPAAFNKLGLSFIAKWVGMEVAEEGGITIKNPQGAFMVNREAGEIFVVSGEAVNNFKKPRASIQVKALVLGPKGEVLMQKTAYCGNALSKEQLATLSMAKIEEAMGSPFGDSLANLGVQPGKSIPFVIVFKGVQKNAAEFSTDVVGSTVASQ